MNYKNLQNTDLDFTRWEIYAPNAYEAIRLSEDDIREIARSTAWPEYRIQRIKNHLFYDEHQLYDGVRRFDPDPDIADAWARLQRGEHSEEDLRLLEHEYFESRYEGIFRTDYFTAHEATLDSGRKWK
ncbi:hypothetical protein NDI39_14680 [Microcoleus sp. ZQ-A2]|nr:hypothetical protein [Microcoleus sp. FACHB-1]